MATRTVVGAPARPNPAPKRTRTRGAPAALPAHPLPQGTRSTDAERAWLAGVDWLASLTPDECALALDVYGAPPAAAWAIDEERRLLILEAACQTDALMEKILGDLPQDTDTVALISMAVRVRDLAGATMSLASDQADSVARLHRKVCGVHRTAEGAAS